MISDTSVMLMMSQCVLLYKGYRAAERDLYE